MSGERSKKQLTQKVTKVIAGELNGIRVLVAEDNSVNQKLVASLLNKAGCSVQIVDNGSDAVSASAEKRFDVILMDCQMPIMGGVEATKLIRARESISKDYVPIIALTAHAMIDDLDECIQAGMDDYLTKPFKGAELTQKIKTWFGNSKSVEA